MQFLTTLELILFLTAGTSASHNKQLYCITHTHGKAHPTNEPSLAQGVCSRYSELSCCTTSDIVYVNQANDTDAENRWPICGSVSKNCSHYLKANNCFYSCDPYLGPWNVSDFGHLYRVPVCASYCNKWFDACKNDRTCSSNWLSSTAAGKYDCTSNQSCQTFAEAFTDGVKMCDTIWGDQYTYSEDESNCMTMFFVDQNPNEHVTSEGYATNQSPTSGSKPSERSAGYSVSPTHWMLAAALFGSVVAPDFR